MEACEIKVRVSYLSDIADRLREIELCLKDINLSKDNFNREMKRATNILLDNEEYEFNTTVTNARSRKLDFAIYLRKGKYIYTTMPLTVHSKSFNKNTFGFM